jgi:hypothetical protein
LIFSFLKKDEKGGYIMKEYFNLNERARRARDNNDGKSFVVTGMPEVFPETGSHLEWNSATLENIEEIPGHLTVGTQVLMYLGTFLGVLLSTAVAHFRSGNVNITITLGEVIASAIIALAIIPLVYEKLSLNPKAPFIVQFGLFVQNGVFWHVLIDSIGSAM